MTPPRRRYRTDLTDAHWQVLAPLIPAPKPGGRPAIHQRRELLNAMLCWLRAGCAWRLLPHDLPPWQTVDHYFRCWRLEGRWQRIVRVLRARERVRQGRRPNAHCRGLGQPKREDDRTGGHMATTAPTRSTAASASCWSTPSACCWPCT